MHPSLAGLIAFHDAQGGAEPSHRIARHVAKCGRCSEQLRRIRCERDELSLRATPPFMESRQGLAGLLSAMAAWRNGPPGSGQRELQSRLRAQIETYFGSPSLTVLEQPGMRAEELLGKTAEVFEVFLGPAAAEAVQDEILGGLDSTRSEGRL